VIAEGFSDVPVRFRHGHGRPAGVLVDESLGCALALVGARGLGGFVGLLMGSVSQQVPAHADCPVAIVRPSVSE
jgi:nucleotide-binding universal stress UspA family protein